MTENVSIADQVTAFLAARAAQASPEKSGGDSTMGVFDGFQAAAPAAPPASGVFAGFNGAAPGAAPAAQAPPSAPFNPPPGASAGSPFAGLNPPEARAAPTPVVAAPGAPFAGFTTPTPAAPTVDPRLAECPPTIDPNRRGEWLAHCDAGGLDHRTGNPKSAPTPVVAPAAQVAPTPGAIVVPDEKTFVEMAGRLYQEGRAPTVGAHPRVVEIYNAYVAAYGPAKIAGAPAAQAPQAPSVNDDATQIVVTKAAVVEMIKFLNSLIA